ncbi:hypothetical protein ACFYY3_13465 [Streptomyces sp. NPDC001812]|uniref:hypothetical protein n=1 Tax=Streptomyces sp. NPDC001812 TaxID=3364611 RepID=UPI0036AB0DDE
MPGSEWRGLLFSVKPAPKSRGARDAALHPGEDSGSADHVPIGRGCSTTRDRS